MSAKLRAFYVGTDTRHCRSQEEAGTREGASGVSTAVEIASGRIVVRPSFGDMLACWRLGGKWDTAMRAWTFPATGQHAMHDGSLATLEDVIDYYNDGGAKNPGLDMRLRPLHLSAEEKGDLAAFLRSLSGRIQEGR